ncbi:hypothetical protein [Endozoicomonas sp. 8E]|uniref:hypothetical protein n=1 Tax=Endozoicomonas sp. 8E TaxID=3035692 RepID=UPI002938FA84|nr:hypothetical protein [Endozoicomonas sp. 8E]WOG27561.1 hypothetical protein P6910_23940 [Endozoicomonas sp. 8E]
MKTIINRLTGFNNHRRDRSMLISTQPYGIEYFWLIGQVLCKAQRREHSKLCDQSCNAARLHGCRS